jgi:hypothetical protein
VSRSRNVPEASDLVMSPDGIFGAATGLPRLERRRRPGLNRDDSQGHGPCRGNVKDPCQDQDRPAVPVQIPLCTGKVPGTPRVENAPCGQDLLTRREEAGGEG